MPKQKHIHLNINPHISHLAADPRASAPTADYQIDIRVAGGWAVTGHYQNHMLKTITLKKSTTTEAH